MKQTENMRAHNIDKFAVIILAAGQGTRMKSDLPKAMHLLNGRPLIDYVVAGVEKNNDRVVVVKAFDNNLVSDYLKDRVEYAVQKEILGTGHAVMSAENLVNGSVDHVIVLYGDMPFITQESIAQLKEKHLQRDNTITLMTTVLPDFNDWRSAFYSFGRIIRGFDGHIIKIVEKKDASVDELKIREVNPSYFCFKADWLWKNLKKLDNKNANQEYYLTDLLKLAIDNGEKISSIEIDPREAVGINNQEDLVKAESII